MEPRKLASIQTIAALSPIPGADAIEVATVLGWQCVVKKGEFQVGDKIIFCEVDSILPPRPEFEFMKSRNYRVKTIKLRGQVSQGLVFPLNLLSGGGEFEEGQDVTEALGVTKFEPELPPILQGTAKGNFPSFIIKTDETRIQNKPSLLSKYPDIEMVGCEKLDGSSVTFYIRDGAFGVCSRNLDLKPSDDNVFWKMAVKYDLETKLRDLNRNIALQGELVGPKIQGNKYGLSEHEVQFFNVFDIDRFSYYNHEQALAILGQLLLKPVPVVWTETLKDKTVPDMVKLAERKSLLNSKIWAEGLVIRPINQTIEVPNYGRLSFKVINPQFLLKFNE